LSPDPFPHERAGSGHETTPYPVPSKGEATPFAFTCEELHRQDPADAKGVASRLGLGGAWEPG